MHRHEVGVPYPIHFYFGVVLLWILWLTEQSLANAELVLAVALLFRRFELELFQTDESDVRFEHDFFTGAPRLGSKGVRVRILGERV